MIGLIVKYMDKIYKVGTPGEGVTLSSCIVRKEFILEAGGMQHGFVGSNLRWKWLNLIKLPSLFLKRINR